MSYISLYWIIGVLFCCLRFEDCGVLVQFAKDQVREISTVAKLFDCVSNLNVHKYFYSDELQVLLAAGFQVSSHCTLFINLSNAFVWTFCDD